MLELPVAPVAFIWLGLLFLTRNVKLKQSFEDARREEKRFFRHHRAYHDLVDRCGIPRLEKKLELEMEHVKRRRKTQMVREKEMQIAQINEAEEAEERGLFSKASETILFMIMCRLNLVDKATFVAVCKKWNSVPCNFGLRDISSPNARKLSESPCLMMVGKDNFVKLLNPLHNTSFPINKSPVEMPSGIICAASFGWLLMACVNIVNTRTALFFFNPSSGETIDVACDPDFSHPCVFVAYKGKEVCICKLDVRRKAWDMIQDLGDKTVFVSHQTSFMVKASVEGAGNKIFPKFRGDDGIVFYSLKTKNFHTFRKIMRICMGLRRSDHLLGSISAVNPFQLMARVSYDD
ncbi:OLC1v1030303C1 [Oldenlandia corymbosa var. corymbosa]|uniref:OLC1v1030303C1 n=1 Tax=Oldenlandia corymbosa var. corymbosa TaxID=529605 RepID=A0AAV1CIS4_OLDCO|nr:OLC1v1030303C1 [Oldenlandia corymbosa var. corymbosa]